MTRACVVCAAAISKGNQSGRCRACNLRAMNADPVTSARRLDAMREVFRSPEVRKRRSDQNLARYADPSARAKVGAGVAARLARDPESKARHAAAAAASIRKWHASDAAKAHEYGRHTKEYWARWWAWCPQDRRDEYAALRRDLGAEEARRVIEEDMAAAERKRVAAMSPFERDAERFRKGGVVVEKPVLHRPDHAHTLGGVASYGGA